ncbi:MAG: SDR family oxidoreductase [Micropruina sp.]|nr:SDR family oxidoreductase [Micropruina sp.]
MTGPLAGRTVLVTGGSRGIGRAVVRAAHRDGATVVLHYASSAASARAVADELGDLVHLVPGDLYRPGAAETIWTAAAAAAGRIDVLVNNAGAWIASPLEDTADGETWDDGWRRNLTLNLTAPADLCRAAIRHFRQHGGGIVVNVASRSSHRGDDADHLAYGAAKGGLLALTKGIARGFAAENILAYAVAPGWVATDLAEDLDPAVLAGLPLREVTPPEDVAEVIAFLASGRSRHTTGATIDITGADYVR